MLLRECMTTEIATVRADDALEAAIAVLDGHSVHHVPVVGNGSVIGMISDRDVLLAVGRSKPATGPAGPAAPYTVRQIMAKPVFCLAAGDRMERATSAMIEHRFGALPVIGSDGKLQGLITESDVVAALRRKKDSAAVAAFLEQPATEQMNVDLVTVGPRTRLVDILDALHSHRIRHLPVVEEGELVGIISDRDARRAIGAAMAADQQAEGSGQYYDDDTTARDIMTAEVHTITGFMTMDEVIDLMLTRGIHCLPVTNDGRLRGIITQTDLLRAVVRGNLLSPAAGRG
jgi:CBS domain-containing protein